MRSADPTPLEELLDAADVARILKASRSWVYKASENGTLPVVRIGALLRFEPAAIRAFVERMRSGKVVPLRTDLITSWLR